MPGSDPSHWLFRLSPDEWLRAADGELARARIALSTKQRRSGLAGARRAAGMAWNGVLSRAPDDAYGRSYMDHLKALTGDASVPDAIRAAARALVDAPLDSALITLGPHGDTHLADAAAAIVEEARERLTPKASA